MNRKCGRKIKPGGQIVDLENQEPCRLQSSKKKKISPVKTKTANYIDKSEDEEEEWRYYDCEEVWDENGDDKRVVWDICSLQFHLQCSGISHNIVQYWDINLELTYFKCKNCWPEAEN